MRVVFSAEARKEFEEAERCYNPQVPGLGERFRADLVRPWRASELGRCPVRASAVIFAV